jgi:hypothetical protein
MDAGRNNRADASDSFARRSPQTIQLHPKVRDTFPQVGLLFLKAMQRYQDRIQARILWWSNLNHTVSGHTNSISLRFTT